MRTDPSKPRPDRTAADLNQRPALSDRSYRGRITPIQTVKPNDSVDFIGIRYIQVGCQLKATI